MSKFRKIKSPWLMLTSDLGYLDPKKAKKCKNPVHDEVGNHDLCWSNTTPEEVRKLKAAGKWNDRRP
jgi:hypothetical protein